MNARRYLRASPFIIHSVKSFREKVLSIVAKIPKGETLSYKEVSPRAGD